jgi:hypothetical protein
MDEIMEIVVKNTHFFSEYEVGPLQYLPVMHLGSFFEQTQVGSEHSLSGLLYHSS